MIGKCLTLSAVALAGFFAAGPAVASNLSASSVVSVPALAKEKAMTSAQLVDRWSALVQDASHRFGIAEEWIRAVIRMESGGRTLADDNKLITSDKGAMGIMQLMPATYKDMRARYGLGANPYDPHDNVIAGTAYLSWLYSKYGYPRMFAAYNAGPGTLEARMAGVRKLPTETRAYVKGIKRILGGAPESEPRMENAVATLTRPDGSTVSIDGAKVDSLRAPLANEYAPGVQTVVAMGNLRQGVREDLATVTALLKPHTAKA